MLTKEKNIKINNNENIKVSIDKVDDTISISANSNNFVNNNELIINNTENISSISDFEKVNEEFEWYIEIPKIKLYAPIEEGTDEDVLNRSIGHFDTTSRRNGNCRICCS